MNKREPYTADHANSLNANNWDSFSIIILEEYDELTRKFVYMITFQVSNNYDTLLKYPILRNVYGGN